MKNKNLSRVLILLLLVVFTTTSVACAADTVTNGTGETGQDGPLIAAQTNVPEASVKSYRGSKQVLVTWTKVDGIDGYKVYRAASADGTYKWVKSVKSGNKRRCKNGELTTGKTYYYKVCTYTLDSAGKKVNGEFSKAIKIKVLGAIKEDPKNKLMLVNRDNRLSSNYVPSSRYSLKGYQTQSVKVKKFVRDAFIELYKGAKKEGYTIKAVSGYRDYALQKWLFNNYVSIDGLAEAQKYSARPGQSEHQTGLAIDVSCAREGWGLETTFGSTPEGKWLAKNAHKYGFIIRYQKGKSGITGYSYEPWHIRYVGTEAAAEIYEGGLTLEEYLGY